MLREKQYAHLQSSKPPVELQRWKRASNIRASSHVNYHSGFIACSWID